MDHQLFKATLCDVAFLVCVNIAWPRIRIMVDKNNQAILETVDTLGHVTVKSGFRE